MILAVDGSRLEGHRTGVGRYVEYLLAAWAGQELPFAEVRVYTRLPVEDLPSSRRFRAATLDSAAGGLWWQVRRLRPEAEQADVLFSMYTVPPGFRGRSVVGNLGILAGPYAVQGLVGRARDRHAGWSARRAEAVLVNSRTTKADIVRHYRVPEPKVRPVQPGISPLFRPLLPADEGAVAAAVERNLGEPGPFVLFVGKLSTRRNVPALAEAVARLRRDHRELRLLLVGPNTGNVPLDELPGGFVHVEFLELHELALLYRAARALVLPTDREGFGHPIVEAMTSRCPVVLLRGTGVGVFDWAAEGTRSELVLEADDASPSGLERALRQIVEDDELHAGLAERGRAFGGTFPTWEEHGRIVMQELAAAAEGAS